MSRTKHVADAQGAVAGKGDLPSPDALAALRAWSSGLSAREAVHRYLLNSKADGQSSRALLSATRSQLVEAAVHRRRPDLVVIFEATERGSSARSDLPLNLMEAMDDLMASPVLPPRLIDDVEMWFSARTSAALHALKIRTLGELTVRVPRRRMWWVDIDGLGARGAGKVTAFFAEHPELTEHARALLGPEARSEIEPWERVRLPAELDGSTGRFRAPASTCALNAKNDYEAVSAWLERHESAATQRAYRKEAERLLLWAIVERGKPMSSLAAEDATAYRAFLRRPTPHMRWVGPSKSRSSPDWRPFTGGLASKSVAYALTVLNSLFRWLTEQRYVTTNPFAGLKVQGGAHDGPLDPARSFTEGEWTLVRVIADGLEWSYGWDKAAAIRLRFVLDFSYATGLRNSEFVQAKLKQIFTGDDGSYWLELVGKGSKRGRVALPPMAMSALDCYLLARGVPTTPSKWRPDTPVVGRVAADELGAISSTRLWAVCRRFFGLAASVVDETNPGLAAKLRKASPHWMRHTHASHALHRGAELTTVRDNLRHASIATTSTYLHGDDEKRTKQLREAFPAS
ncbi:phage integrase family protein [Roseateles sp. P5_E8]